VQLSSDALAAYVEATERAFGADAINDLDPASERYAVHLQSPFGIPMYAL
jgi:hypothetical protein